MKSKEIEKEFFSMIKDLDIEKNPDTMFVIKKSTHIYINIEFNVSNKNKFDRVLEKYNYSLTPVRSRYDNWVYCHVKEKGKFVAVGDGHFGLTLSGWSDDQEMCQGAS